MDRRSFLRRAVPAGVALMCAPTIVRASSLMPVRALPISDSVFVDLGGGEYWMTYRAASIVLTDKDGAYIRHILSWAA